MSVNVSSCFSGEFGGTLFVTGQLRRARRSDGLTGGLGMDCRMGS